MKKKAKQSIDIPANDRDFQWGLEKAHAKGLVIVEPRRNQIQLDIDSGRACRIYGMQFSILRKAGICKGWREYIRPSRRRGHIHITINLPRSITNKERVMFQAVLGSDLRREAFNLCRVINKNKYPIAFFEEAK